MATVLVTNDDGIDSPGLHELARVVLEAGHTPLVAAPADDQSGTAASVTVPAQEDQLAFERRVLPGLSGVAAYAVPAPPALITLVALREGFGETPSLVVSGINRGTNTGHAILHSGTVGAALTAAAAGHPAMAVSVAARWAPEEPLYWESAARYVPELLPVLEQADSPLVLNVNAPDLPARELRGLREATLAPFGTVQTNVEVGDGYVQLALTGTSREPVPGSDEAWLARGFATVSAIKPIFEVADVSLHAVVESVRR